MRRIFRSLVVLLLRLDDGGRDTLDFGLLQLRIRSLAGTSEACESVWLNPRGAGYSVQLDIVRKRSARRVVGVGLAYDNELGGTCGWAQ